MKLIDKIKQNAVGDFILLVIACACFLTFFLIFLFYGSFMASCKWELRRYWKSVSVSLDKTLNVSGKYALNQALAHEPVFGNDLQTVSTAMYFARLHKYGEKWENRINKVDDDHFEKSAASHFKDIENEYKRLLKSASQ